MKKIVIFLTYLYPNRDDFFKILDLLDKSNIFGVEIGLPDENAYLDGDTIKDINKKILKRGFSLEEFEKDLEYIYSKYNFKTILMGYKSSIDKLNLNKLKNSYHGIIVVDKTGYYKQIPFISKENSETINLEEYSNSLFAYVMSGSGKTGSFDKLPNEYIESIKNIKSISNLDCFVGFGIKNKEDIEQVIENGADGAIIGSSFLKKATNFETLKEYVNNLF